MLLGGKVKMLVVLNHFFEMSNLNIFMGIEDDEVVSKICSYCGENKFLSEYPKHKNHKDNLDSRCKQCISERAKKRNLIRKTAPPKPDVCECCGKDPTLQQYHSFWILDEDHENDCFRGWLCNGCNLAIGYLGDNIEGVLKAFKYLKRKEE